MSAPTFRSQAPWFLVLIAATLPSLASSQTAADTKTLTLEMYLDLESVSNPQISPDGARIVYTRGWVDKMNDRRESSIWIMNADGSKNHFLVDGSGPLWSPDGTRISYTASGEPEGSQIFVRWMDDEGATTQITRLEKGPGGITWSPDGQSISFSMNVDGEPAWSVNPPGRPDGATWTEGPKVVTRADYRQDRQGFIDEGWQHVFVVPAEGGTPRQLTNGDWNHSTGRWTADGSELLFSSLRTEDSELSWRESEIYAVNVATEEIRQLTTRRGQDTGPLPSPRGDLIAYRGSDFNTDTYRNSGVYVMNLDGSGSRLISGDFDRNINSMEWAHDGSGVYVTISYQGARNVHFISVQGVVSEVTSGAHMLGLSSFTDQGFAVATLSGPQVPADIVSFDLDGPISFRQLTNVNDDIMAGVTLGDVEEIWYESLDGFQIQGWVIKPPDFDPGEKYPLMLSIHGGPHGMYNVGFNFAWQEHAANGYVILYTNPRGSSGYGSPFGNAIKNAYPGKDFDDLMNGVDLVISRGYVDEQNMFVYGCSGGGVLTSWVVGHTDRFAAASANCPVTNWLSFVGTTDGIGWYRNFEKFPWDDPSEHLRRSPLMYVGNVTTPTMLMTGVSDLRTPMPQTEEYYAALKVMGVESAMIRFNNEWHGTSSTPSNFLRTQLFLREWFKRYEQGRSVTF
ncbi:MAG TPA: S9 family peptidase [Gemmatimonadetes bacterium]|jgi:dipeptidyl aminopeptidase/acylaminoacyl peptidase|nr:S9 family peptidase [Gemmatimonadota bacterium]|tara:strand:- start:2707 stop:4746 length:2040 start_codon:yes stop_codon:yes gene_type:complete